MKYLIGLLFAASVCAQGLRVDTVPRSVIEQRLDQAAAKNTVRQARLKEMLQSAGCSAVEQPVRGVKQPNLLCTMDGTGESTIVVGAHYDSTEEGAGVVDNWSGAALLPSLLEAMQKAPRKHRFLFVGFSGEEKGLLGSREFVKKLTADEREHIRAAVILDSVGMSPAKIWPNGSDKTLSEYWGRVASALHQPVQGVNVDAVGTTDSESFRAKKIPTLVIHSVTQENFAKLNGRDDTRKAVREEDYWQTYRLVAGYLVFLDTTLP